jgi:hypothetical protein
MRWKNGMKIFFRDLGFEADIIFSRIRGSKDLHTVPLSRSIGNS